MNENVFLNSFIEYLSPPRDISVDEWAEENRVLVSTSSSEPGLYRYSRTPFLKFISQKLSVNDPAELIIFKKPVQVGGTEAAINAIGYWIDEAPAPILVVEPTRDMAEKFTRDRVDKMIENCESLKRKVAPKNDKNLQNNSFKKDFVNGKYMAVGANSAAGLRMMPIKFLILDEVDGYPEDLEGEGSPIELARARQTSFSRKKTFINSTPTIEGRSQIEKYFLMGNQMYYNFPCPHCKGLQKLVFGQLKYEVEKENDIFVKSDSVFYECIFCNHKIKEHLKNYLLNHEEAKWIAENEEAPENIFSFSLNALYSPWKTWEEICNDFLASKSDPVKMKNFVNTILGETYKEKSHQPDFSKLYHRREDFQSFEAPKEVIYVCAGADTQDNRIAINVLGFGEDQEMFVIDYSEILGSPEDMETWEKVRRYIDTPIRHESGLNMYIDKLVIDTQGHKSSFVYDFAEKNQDKVLAIKGSPTQTGIYFREGKKLEINQYGKPYQNAISLYLIDTIMAKKAVYNALSIKDPGPKYVHFNKDLHEGYFKMLTSEQYMIKVIKGRVKEEFHLPSGTRNEALDCFGYALAYAHSKGISKEYGERYKETYKLLILDELEKQKKKEEEKKEKEIIKNNKFIQRRREQGRNGEGFGYDLNFD